MARYSVEIVQKAEKEYLKLPQSASELPRCRLLHLRLIFTPSPLSPFPDKVVYVEDVEVRKDFLNLRELF